MLTPGFNIFVRLQRDCPTDSPLRPGAVSERREDRCVLEVNEIKEPPAAEESLMLYFDVKGKFTEQRARIERCLNQNGRTFICVRLLGEPKISENRQSFRLNTAMARLCAQFCDAKESPLIDVSYTGFAVVSENDYQIGSTVTAVIRFEGQTYSGPCVVRSARPVGTTETRYGLHVLPSRGPTALQKGLQAIVSAVQRMQLQRMARDA